MCADENYVNDPSDDILEFDPDADDGALEFDPGSAPDPEQSKGELIRRAAALGLNTEEGIRNCNNDENLYGELLRLYAAEGEDKTGLLKKHLGDGNLKDYRVVIHAVKSTSRTIGAGSLYEMARKLEEAAKTENREFIDSYQDVFLELYKDLTEMLASVSGL